ncbi:hypothetical protein HYH02_014062 [Chlamydomonas schloesseri]|uniref:Uncharacterized protein n=1 Tax=Chlamydomonas schloesseri TaxID=2026947 RepID=A0A835SQE3_9CHLO|nr:hypothetical protein HYH02_014062 [Chlamydomonas schloesseri]|eukprot:KAG2429407.1 hypothetical protein HYH02_014062 [Chlamydomonas schloesseri]
MQGQDSDPASFFFATGPEGFSLAAADDAWNEGGYQAVEGDSEDDVMRRLRPSFADPRALAGPGAPSSSLRDDGRGATAAGGAYAEGAAAATAASRGGGGGGGLGGSWGGDEAGRRRLGGRWGAGGKGHAEPGGGAGTVGPRAHGGGGGDDVSSLPWRSRSHDDARRHAGPTDRMPYYGGGDVLPRDQLPPYGYVVGTADVPLPYSSGYSRLHGGDEAVGATAGGAADTRGGGGSGTGSGAAGVFGAATAQAARAAAADRGESSGGGAAGGGVAVPTTRSWPAHGERPEEGFVSGGRHVLYWWAGGWVGGWVGGGADIPLDDLTSGHWHHSPRPPGVSSLQAVASGGGGGGSRGGGGVKEGGGITATASGGGGGGGGAVLEDDVMEVETDTPGGYHVAARVLHPADSRDPQEFVVTATSVSPPK